jgi:arylsulfatase A-like enzyme
VQVNWFRGPDEPSDAPCWDSHVKEAHRLRTALAPPFDQAHSALLEDLIARRMLDETLVVCLAEFGRTPRINANAGRDHWGNVFSLCLAGGGVQGGMVHGASDAVGGEPRDGAVHPPDLLATLFHLLGYPPATEFRDPFGRPLAVSRGEPIRAILTS